MSTLNSVALEYAMSVMENDVLTGEEFKKILKKYYTPLNSKLIKNEAIFVNRQKLLTRMFVVVSCVSSVGRHVYFSDYSGKKNRNGVLKEFPNRKNDFVQWYPKDGKPYQHEFLYKHINAKLGKIGGGAPNVGHPIGYCAEQNVANRFILETDDKNISKIKFSIAIRPKTGEVVQYCDNCKKLFPQLK